jgi:hypothetical protein
MSCGYGRLGRQDRPPGRLWAGRPLAAGRDPKRVSFCVERSVEHTGSRPVLGHTAVQTQETWRPDEGTSAREYYCKNIDINVYLLEKSQWFKIHNIVFIIYFYYLKKRDTL